MTPLLPGATIGVLGGGQLGRMLALEARRMGYRVAVLDPDPAGPGAQLADELVQGAWDDAAAALELARRCDVITLETEHIPASVIEALEPVCPVRPGATTMAVIQDRLRQREFLARHQLPQAPHRGVGNLAALEAALAELGAPAILKTRRFGYDGRGQARVEAPAGCAAAWEAIGAQPAMLEGYIDFRCEVSVVLARDAAGRVAAWPLAENEHRRHVLHLTVAPARLPAALAADAVALATRVAEALDYVGVLAVEMFVTGDGGLLVNEVAPRVHNSGHYTFGASVTSQFEQHLRAICGLPLGDPALPRPAVMLNLLGDLWARGEPDWGQVFRHPGAKLHLYGKAAARPGRKMGHVVVTDDGLDRALAISAAIHAALERHAGIAPSTSAPHPRPAPISSAS